MYTTRLLEQKLTSVEANLESKKHEAIIAFEKFYQSQTLIQVVELFIQKDKQAEIDYVTRMNHQSPEERESLSQWAEEKYGMYIDAHDELSEVFNPRERYWLGVMLRNGYGVKKDETRGIKCTQQAAEEQDGFACNKWVFSEQDPLRKKDFRLKAIATGCVSALYESALEHEPKEYMQAVADYTKSAAAGFASSLRNLGLCFQNGELGFDRNFPQAFDYFMRAAARGSSEALADLGRMYMFEFYSAVTPQNKDTARQLFEAAIKRNPDLPRTRLYLGNILKEIQNLGEAARYYRGSLKLECADAQEALWDLFQKEKSDPRVSYHAAIGFQTKGTEEQKKATRREFNELYRTHPDIVRDLSREDESPESIQDLIDFDESELESFRLLFNVLSEIQWHDNQFLSKETILIALAYLCPFKEISENIVKQESLAKYCLQDLKKYSEAFMFTFFGARDHLDTIKAAEENRMSYTTAYNGVQYNS